MCSVSEHNVQLNFMADRWFITVVVEDKGIERPVNLKN